MNPTIQRLLAFLVTATAAPSAFAFNILVDYSLDTNNFFNTQAKKDAMQAVADRYARVITSTLLPVNASYQGGNTDWRIGFTHPSTGASYQISTAANAADDFIDDLSIGGNPVGPANLYNSAFNLPANTWLLYVGARASLGSAAVGGTGTGVNVTSVFDDVNGPMHRGAIANTPAISSNDLPAWGGSISFDTSIDWHFDLNATAPTGKADFYSIALHEVGHALGLSTSWNQWKSTAGIYGGINGVAAYNKDNGTTRTGLNQVSAANPHWLDGAYDSFIFPLASPNLVGTVGLATKQDLLMEPTANFGNPLPLRFELTNVDVGALRDLGWSVVPEPSAILLAFAGAGWLSLSRGPRRR